LRKALQHEKTRSTKTPETIKAGGERKREEYNEKIKNQIPKPIICIDATSDSDDSELEEVSRKSKRSAGMKIKKERSKKESKIKSAKCDNKTSKKIVIEEPTKIESRIKSNDSEPRNVAHKRSSSKKRITINIEFEDETESEEIPDKKSKKKPSNGKHNKRH